MSFYFRDKSKFGDKLRGKSGDELLQEIKQQFDEDSKSFFEPTNRSGRDPFERHAGFSRVSKINIFNDIFSFYFARINLRIVGLKIEFKDVEQVLFVLVW